MGFMNRRKAKEQEDGPAPDSQLMPSSTSKKSKKGKKNAPEPKVELDLSTALPGDDSFRTSLMMTNFTARFSMLREQDDPNTKIGKASDDSVLFPKRASRLNLFNHNPLTDIAEVSSVRSSLIKPPFAREEPPHALSSDGYASDEGGSIMNRSKPGEGNNLFGGRQKLYRIPVGASSVKTLPESDVSEKEASGMNGRVVYQNDVSLSMFQQIREQDREERRQREQREQHHRSDSSHHTEMDETEGASSPSTTAFSKDRGTTSSTTSGPLGHRTSTAATSVASEPRGSFAESRSATGLVTSAPIAEEAAPWDPPATVQRKLYGQAVDPSSPTHRAVRNVLESSTRPRAPTYEKKPHMLSPSKSASNLAGKYSRPGPFAPPATFRTASPPPPPPSSSTPPGMVPMDLGVRDSGPPGASSGPAYGSLPPLSPPPSDGEDVLTYANSLQPEDRGKATAMGLFNRPQKQYDELQFSQRQLQMHEGRISPMPSRQSPDRREDAGSPFPLTESLERGRYSPSNHRDPPPPPESRYSPPGTSAARPGPRHAPRRPSSGALNQPPGLATARAPLPPPPPPPPPTSSPGTVARARARADSGRSRPDPERAAPESSPRQTIVRVSDPAAGGTFLDNFSPSDEEPDAPFEPGPPPSRRPPSDVHPALRDGTIDFGFEPSVPATGPSSRDDPDRALSEPSPPSGDENDSSPMALSSAGGLGLSGMIRSHLRHDSDRSSIYPPAPVAVAPASGQESPRGGTSVRSQNQPESIHSNPWEFDEVHARPGPAEGPDETHDPLFIMSQRAKQIRGQATAFQTHAMTKARQVLGDDAPLSAVEAPAGRSWHDEMRLRHQRDGSTETKEETQKFDNELAERRRMVEETFQSRIETNQRPASPMRYPDRTAPGPVHPLSALKHKTSKSSMRPRHPEPPNKAMKMLGITNGGLPDGAPDRTPEDRWKEEEERMLREHARRKARSPATPMNGPRPPYHGAPRAASPRTSPPDEGDRSRQRSVTPTTARNPRRDRAEPSTYGPPPRTRGGRPREEPERQMIAGTGNYGGLYDKPPKPPSVISLPRPSLDAPDHELYERAPSAPASGRQRSNSRHTAPGYFDPPSSMPAYHEPAAAHELPPPLPIQAYSANSTPPLTSPAHSTVSTPTLVAHPFAHDGGLPSAFGHRPAALSGRKKSVTKNMISDPTLLSSTSNIPAVSLPAPPDFRPHELASPPLPVMNPRRRRQTTTTTQVVTGAGIPDTVESRLVPTPESPNRPRHRFEERSTFSDDGEQRQPKQRARLRKTSSEGGSMNVKARQQAMMASSPAMPRFPPGIGYSKPPPAHALNGGMF